MLKLIALISKKPDITREAFIDYYEANHAPLIKRLLPMIGEYRRSYITPGMVPGGDVALDYDVVTELTFEDQGVLDAFWETITRPEVLAAIREDESHFLQSDRTRMIGVHEYVSDS
jgi:hypothetical protein